MCENCWRHAGSLKRNLDDLAAEVKRIKAGKATLSGFEQWADKPAGQRGKLAGKLGKGIKAGDLKQGVQDIERGVKDVKKVVKDVRRDVGELRKDAESVEKGARAVAKDVKAAAKVRCARCNRIRYIQQKYAFVPSHAMNALKAMLSDAVEVNDRCQGWHFLETHALNAQAAPNCVILCIIYMPPEYLNCDGLPSYT